VSQRNCCWRKIYDCKATFAFATLSAMRNDVMQHEEMEMDEFLQVHLRKSSE